MNQECKVNILGFELSELLFYCFGVSTPSLQFMECSEIEIKEMCICGLFSHLSDFYLFIL